MPRESGDFEKVTIRLYKGDADRLATYFPQLGYNRAIRDYIHKLLRSLDEKAQQKGPLPELNLPEVNTND